MEDIYKLDMKLSAIKRYFGDSDFFLVLPVKNIFSKQFNIDVSPMRFEYIFNVIEK